MHGLVQAHRHPAEGVRQLHEAREVDLGVVVDLRAGEGFDRRDECGAARLASAPVELGTGDALRGQLFLGGGEPAVVRRLILCLPLPSARVTYESRGMEIATAGSLGSAGTCSRMIVSVCS